MKKKILGMMFALTVMFTCSCLFSACGDTPPARTLSSISYQVNTNSAYYNNFYDDKFNFAHGDEINLTKADFVVTAHYSNNDTEVISDYTLNTSGIGSDVGTYQITISFSTAQAITIDVVISENMLDLNHISSLDCITSEKPIYSGNEIDIIEVIDNELTTQSKQTLTELKDANIIDVSGETTGTNAGDYYFTIEVIDANYGSAGLQVGWAIKKAVIEKPMLYPLTFNGTEDHIEGTAQSPNIGYAQGTQSFITCTNANETHTNVGTYAYEFVCDSNHTFVDASDNEVSTISLNSTISKKQLQFSKPQLRKSNLPYKGSAYAISDLWVYNKPYSTYFDFNYSDTDINWPNDYTLRMTEKENVALNYMWQDGTAINHEYTYNLTVTKATPSYNVTEADTTQNLVFEMTYDPYNTTLSNIVDVSNLTESSKTWASGHIGFDENKASFKAYKEDTPEDEQVLTPQEIEQIVYYTPENGGYNWIEIKVTIKINKIKEQIKQNWEISSTEVVKSGESVEYDGNAHANTLPDPFYSNVNQNKVTLEYITYYKSTENGTYGTQPVTNATNAGYYKTVVTVASDIYSFYNNESEDITVIEKEWQITKKEVGIDSWIWWNINFDQANPDHLIYMTDGEITIHPQTISASSVGTKVEFDTLYFYKATQDGTYSEVNIVEDVAGYYKAVATLNYDQTNYTFTYSENKLTLEFKLLSNTIDCSGVTLAYPDNTTIYANDNIKIKDLFNGIPENAMLVIDYNQSEKDYVSLSQSVFKPESVLQYAGKYTLVVSFGAIAYTVHNSGSNIHLTLPDNPLTIHFTVKEGSRPATVAGKTFVCQTIEAVDGSGNPLANDDQVTSMAANFGESNLGKTIIFNTDGNLQGSCDFGSGTFDEQFATAMENGDSGLTYTINSENPSDVTITQTENSDILGTFDGTTLVLNMETGINSNKFFKVTLTVQA